VTGTPPVFRISRSISAFVGACAIGPSGPALRPLLLNIA